MNKMNKVIDSGDLMWYEVVSFENGINFAERKILVEELRQTNQWKIFSKNDIGKTDYVVRAPTPKLISIKTRLNEFVQREVAFLKKGFAFNQCALVQYEYDIVRNEYNSKSKHLRALIFFEAEGSLLVYRCWDTEGKYPIHVPISDFCCVILHGSGLYDQEGIPSYEIKNVPEGREGSFIEFRSM